MKYFLIFLLLAGAGLIITNKTNAQQNKHIFEQSAPAAADSSSFNVLQLYVPDNAFKPVYIDNPANPFPPYRPIKGLTRALLILGTDLIRDNENSIYSFGNSWNYPGPTVKYPQSSTDLELFLERYNKYTSDSQ